MTTATPDSDAGATTTAVPVGRWRRATLRLLAVSVVVIGSNATWFVLRHDAQPSAATAPLATARAERRSLTASFAVRGAARFRPLSSLASPVGGVVTEVVVKSGETVTAGQLLLRTEGRPLVAMSGGFPFWRSIEAGSQGADVRQLKSFLAAAGFDPGAVDETFTAMTGRALAGWQEAKGLPKTGKLEPSDVAVGPWPARAGSVRVKVGDRLSPDAPLLDLTEKDMSVELSFDAGDRLRARVGQRVVVEVTATRQRLDGELRSVADNSTKAPQASSGGESSGQSAQSTSEVYRAEVKLQTPIDAVDGAQVRAEVILAEAPNVVAVPIAALVLDGAGDAAVSAVGPKGRTTQKKVVTGLQQGAFVEIVSGLDEGEAVVIGAGQ